MFWFANNQFPTFVYVKRSALSTNAFTRGNDLKYLKNVQLTLHYDRNKVIIIIIIIYLITQVVKRFDHNQFYWPSHGLYCHISAQ